METFSTQVSPGPGLPMGPPAQSCSSPAPCLSLWLRTALHLGGYLPPSGPGGCQAQGSVSQSNQSSGKPCEGTDPSLKGGFEVRHSAVLVGCRSLRPALSPLSCVLGSDGGLGRCQRTGPCLLALLHKMTMTSLPRCDSQSASRLWCSWGTEQPPEGLCPGIRPPPSRRPEGRGDTGEAWTHVGEPCSLMLPVFLACARA